MTRRPNVTIDSREPKWVLSGINNIDNIYAKKKKLPVGDISIGGGCIIERKEIKNMYTDIIDNDSDRPWSQIRNMKDNFEESHLICHGTRADLKSWKNTEEEREEHKESQIKCIMGTGRSIQMDWDVHFWKVDGIKDFFGVIKDLFERETGSKRSSKPYTATRVSASMEERTSAILCQIPYVGPSRAKKLIQNYDTLKEISNLSKDDLIDLLGEKTGKSTYEVFNDTIK